MVTEVAGKEGILVTGGCNNNCLDHLDDTLFFDFATEKWEVSNFYKERVWADLFKKWKYCFSDFGSQVEHSSDENENGGCV